MRAWGVGGGGMEGGRGRGERGGAGEGVNWDETRVQHQHSGLVNIFAAWASLKM